MRNFNKYNFANKKAIVRVDFNVPLNDKLKVTDNTRIKAALPTIQKILDDGGSVVLMSHLGRPKKGPEPKFSLQNVVKELEKLLERPVLFSENTIGLEAKKAVAQLEAGEVLLLENLRFNPGEKKGYKRFAKALANLGCDVYVNDAFGTAHRAHASTSIIAQYFPKKDRLPGLLMTKEIENATSVLKNKEKPFTAILGGAKVSDKINLIENLLKKANNILIGGAMAFTFIKAQGGQVGNSLVEDDKLDLALELLEKAKKKKVNIVLPEDAVAADAFDNKAKTKTCASNEIPDDWMGLDIGKKACKAYAEIIEQSKVIIWNGPMGVFEMSKFQKGTKNIALSVGAATDNGAFSLVGGGDSVAAVKKFKLEDQISFVSTGGGAMLEFFEGKELPGIKALS